MRLQTLPEGIILRHTNAPKEATMPRKYIDCRDFPSANNCTLAISGSEEGVLDLAVLHASTVHGHQNTPQLREQIRSMLKDEPAARAAGV